MEKRMLIQGSISKLKEHHGALVHKVDTVKLRDMLKQKCRIRVKDWKNRAYDGSREFIEVEKIWIKKMFDELESDILLEDAILEELIEEQYQWMIEQYEQSTKIDLTGDPTSLLVMCPICEVAELKFNEPMLSCQCGFQYMYNGTLEDFSKCVKRNVAEHEEKCALKLSFFVDPNESALNMMCNVCNFLALIE